MTLQNFQDFMATVVKLRQNCPVQDLCASESPLEQKLQS